MSDGSKVISDLAPLASAVANTELVVVQTFANGVTNSFNLPIVNAFAFVPGPYANDAVANTNGVGVKSIYYDASGFLHIRLT